jgi:hypothetical protein
MKPGQHQVLIHRCQRRSQRLCELWHVTDGVERAGRLAPGRAGPVDQQGELGSVRLGWSRPKQRLAEHDRQLDRPNRWSR